MNIYLDYFSSSRISGWSDIKSRKNDRIFLLNKKNNKKYDITDEVKYLREDVNSLLDIQYNIRTGFDISLFEKFNDRVNDFCILHNENIVWSYKRELRKLYNIDNHKSEITKNTGTNQVLVVYKENSWLHNSIKSILSLQKSFFSKNFSSGISFYFCSIFDLAYRKAKLNLNDMNLILITEEDIYKDVLIAENNLSNACPIVFDGRNKLEDDFFGLRQALISLSNLKDKENFDNVDVFNIFDTMTAYSRMFFPIKDFSYIYIKGFVNERASAWARNINYNNKGFNFDIIFLCTQLNVDLKSLDEENVCVIARSDKIIRLYDLIDLDVSKLAKICYRRGLKVKIIEGINQ